MPPVCNLLEYMGAAIENMQRRRGSDCEYEESNNTNSDSETLFCQEKKNMEYFFKPRDIENHVDMVFN
jgi:hypothetical protein